MKKKIPYVSPTIISVKLEPTQAVLSQCSVGVVALWRKKVSGSCNVAHNCKQANAHAHGGDSAATS